MWPWRYCSGNVIGRTVSWVFEGAAVSKGPLGRSYPDQPGVAWMPRLGASRPDLGGSQRRSGHYRLLVGGARSGHGAERVPVAGGALAPGPAARSVLEFPAYRPRDFRRTVRQ